jgi:hypothetical protein
VAGSPEERRRVFQQKVWMSLQSPKHVAVDVVERSFNGELKAVMGQRKPSQIEQAHSSSPHE